MVHNTKSTHYEPPFDMGGGLLWSNGDRPFQFVSVSPLWFP